jgi:hypothetical protein
VPVLSELPSPGDDPPEAGEHAGQPKMATESLSCYVGNGWEVVRCEMGVNLRLRGLPGSGNSRTEEG